MYTMYKYKNYEAQRHHNSLFNSIFSKQMRDFSHKKAIIAKPHLKTSIYRWPSFIQICSVHCFVVHRKFFLTKRHLNRRNTIGTGIYEDYRAQLPTKSRNQQKRESPSKRVYNCLCYELKHQMYLQGWISNMSVIATSSLSRLKLQQHTCFQQFGFPVTSPKVSSEPS